MAWATPRPPCFLRSKEGDTVDMAFERCRRCGQEDYLVPYTHGHLCLRCVTEQAQRRPAKVIDFVEWVRRHGPA